MEYLVNNFYDGCCIDVGPSSLLIDFGSQQRKQVKNNKGFFQTRFRDKLLISHYHTDHYNKLFDLKKRSILINELIYPYIPLIDSKEMKDEKTLKKMIVFYNILSIFSETGVPSCGLIKLLKDKCAENFTPRNVKMGDRISIIGDTYDVIWPPKEISHVNCSIKLVSGIKKIMSVIKKDDVITKFWDKFEREFRNKNYENDEDLENYEFEQEEFKKINPLIKKELSKEIRNITNRLSICLYKEDKFLFLGDLEKEEISCCIDYLKKNYYLNHVKYLIAPHHGTHWHDRLLDIYAENLIISNGKKMIVNYKEQFNRIAGNIHHTYMSGDIRFCDGYGCRCYFLPLAHTVRRPIILGDCRT